MDTTSTPTDRSTSLRGRVVAALAFTSLAWSDRVSDRKLGAR
jgi:hypothetical protein